MLFFCFLLVLYSDTINDLLKWLRIRLDYIFGTANNCHCTQTADSPGRCYRRGSGRVCSKRQKNKWSMTLTLASDSNPLMRCAWWPCMPSASHSFR